MNGDLFSWLSHPTILVGLGGALGANARYWLTRALAPLMERTGFPVATLAINLTGSFILGFVVVMFLKRLPVPQHHWFLLFGTGFCGGYTTFSTFSLELVELIREEKRGLCGLYVLLSVVGGMAAAWLGLLLAERLIPPRV